jgi:hypothetical protein
MMEKRTPPRGMLGILLPQEIQVNTKMTFALRGPRQIAREISLMATPVFRLQARA